MPLQPLKLDYFYGGEADQYSFYRIPKVLFTDPRYTAIFGGMEKPVEPEAIAQPEPTPKPMPEIVEEKAVAPEAPADAPSETASDAEQPAEPEKHSSAWLPLCLIAIGAACGVAWYFRRLCHNKRLIFDKISVKDDAKRA